jgi:hypothetical protein
MRITRRNGDEYIGTAKIINRSADQATNVERVASDESIPKNEGPAFDTRVRIEVVSYRTRLADADGISAKAAIDGLVKAGIIRDDSPKYVEAVTYRQVKVGSKAEEKTELILEKCE